MRLHRFFVSEAIPETGDFVIQDSALYHQLRNVFRFTVGGQVILLDNSGYEYLVMIIDFPRSGVAFTVISKKEDTELPSRELHMFISLIKNSNVELVLQKGTELGVTQFIPVISERSEKKSFNRTRAEKIIQEASEQCGRSTLPILSEVRTLEEVMETDFPLYAFDPKGDVFTIEHTHNHSPLGVLIGPEGGWTDAELRMFTQSNVYVYSLGPFILRAETAAIAVASLILLQ